MVVPKFRAWVEAEETMHPVLSLDWSGIDDDLTVFVPMGHTSSRAVSIDNAVLMRSTGLVDKNGKEIFEGDVVEFEDADDIENVYTNRGVVEWCQGGFTVTNRATVSMDDLLDGDKLELEIIGNIYENPELVGG
ncbi:YopX family protein [Streptococcus suis]|uniref:YopX family protein n=2 Tax=Streptococcus suis TaxID=1307 RepID=UPI0038BC98A0